jgi:hypothetical protein
VDVANETIILPRSPADESAVADKATAADVEVPAELERATGGAMPESDAEVSDQDDET